MNNGGGAYAPKDARQKENDAMAEQHTSGAVGVMPLFRKRPVVIEAAQWFKNGDHPLDYSKDHDGFEDGELRTFSAELRKANNWEGDVVRYFRRPDVDGHRGCRHCSHKMHDHGWIDTLEGGHVVCPGDFIITGVSGERYPCKPDIFAATYEPATPPHQESTPAASSSEPSVTSGISRAKPDHD